MFAWAWNKLLFVWKPLLQRYYVETSKRIGLTRNHYYTTCLQKSRSTLIRSLSPRLHLVCTPDMRALDWDLCIVTLCLLAQWKVFGRSGRPDCVRMVASTWVTWKRSGRGAAWERGLEGGGRRGSTLLTVWKRCMEENSSEKLLTALLSSCEKLVPDT